MKDPEQNNENLPRGRGIYLLPNLFTLTALFAGFYAIVSAMQNRFETAAVSIFVAMIMDTLDGRVARLTHTQTEFGAQLDSLSDMVSFGIAPALMAYAWGLEALGKIGWLISFFYAACVALRLARFNVQHNVVDKRYFIGLPCPAGAAAVVGLIWTFSEYFVTESIVRIIASVVIVGISLLMVSNLKFNSFKEIDLKHKVSFVVILLIVLAYVFIAFEPALILFVIALGYALSGPVGYIWQKKKSIK